MPIVRCSIDGTGPPAAWPPPRPPPLGGSARRLLRLKWCRHEQCKRQDSHECRASSQHESFLAREFYSVVLIVGMSDLDKLRYPVGKFERLTSPLGHARPPDAPEDDRRHAVTSAFAGRRPERRRTREDLPARRLDDSAGDSPRAGQSHECVHPDETRRDRRVPRRFDPTKSSCGPSCSKPGAAR